MWEKQMWTFQFIEYSEKILKYTKTFFIPTVYYNIL